MEERVQLRIVENTQATVHDISQQGAKMDHCETFRFPVPPKAFEKQLFIGQELVDCILKLYQPGIKLFQSDWRLHDKLPVFSLAPEKFVIELIYLILKV